MHRDYRTRLDMYCSLTLVFSVLAVAAVGLMWDIEPAWAAVTAWAANMFMAMVAYEAAVASARGYGVASLEVDRVANPDSSDAGTAMASRRSFSWKLTIGL